jgi:hypothetical protein
MLTEAPETCGKNHLTAVFAIIVTRSPKKSTVIVTATVERVPALRAPALRAPRVTTMMMVPAPRAPRVTTMMMVPAPRARAALVPRARRDPRVTTMTTTTELHQLRRQPKHLEMMMMTTMTMETTMMTMDLNRQKRQ